MMIIKSDNRHLGPLAAVCWKHTPPLFQKDFFQKELSIYLFSNLQVFHEMLYAARCCICVHVPTKTCLKTAVDV